MRITKEILRNKLDMLNSMCSEKYVLDYAYGGVRLCRSTNEYGGLSDMSERVTQFEMGRILDTVVSIVAYKKYNHN